MKHWPTKYWRREPTTDDVLRKYAPKARRFDTVFYNDRYGRHVYARRPWHHSGHPTRRSTHYTLFCFRWRLRHVCGPNRTHHPKP